MRLEGFLSLVGCVALLFILGIGLGALLREARLLLPDAQAPTEATVERESEPGSAPSPASP